MKWRYALIALYSFFSLSVLAQQKDTAGKDKIYTYVEQMPKAGYDYNKYLSENLHYPEFAQRNNIQGRVIVRFVVDEDGMLSDVAAVRGIGGGCDEEAVRVVRGSMPWEPGIQNGKPVKVMFTMPIVFKLMEDTLAEKEDENKVYTYADIMPQSDINMQEYINKNLHCPASAVKRTSNSILVKCIVNKDGKISDCTIIKGAGSGCDEEVCRVVNNMPNWHCAKMNGKPVRAYYTTYISLSSR